MRLERWTGVVLVTAALATGCGEGGGGEPRGGGPLSGATTTTTTSTTSSVAPLPPTTAPPTGPTTPFPVFDGISPTSRAELVVLQAEVDASHQPGRRDPVATARAYLASIGIPDPVMGGPTEVGRRTVEVRFDAAVGGSVLLRELGEGSLPYVVRVESAQFDNVVLERRDGEFRVEGYSRAPGTLLARAGAFASEWEVERSVPVDVGPVTVTLDVDQGEYPKILQLRHQGADGKVGVAVFRLQPMAPPVGSAPRGDRLSSSSEVTHSGIGPIMVGMTLDEALVEAGVPMVMQSGPYCDVLRPTGALDGIDLIFPAESDVRVRLFTVSTAAVATETGIRVGSTEAEVLAAYPEIEAQGSGDFHRLVDHADDDSRALVFDIRGSRVAAMHGGLGVEAEEYCS